MTNQEPDQNFCTITPLPPITMELIEYEMTILSGGVRICTAVEEEEDTVKIEKLIIPDNNLTEIDEETWKLIAFMGNHFQTKSFI